MLGLEMLPVIANLAGWDVSGLWNLADQRLQSINDAIFGFGPGLKGSQSGRKWGTHRHQSGKRHSTRVSERTASSGNAPGQLPPEALNPKP